MTAFDSYIKLTKSASLVDAMGRKYNHRFHIDGLICPTPGKVLFGQAVTMQFLPVREDRNNRHENNFASMFYRAIENGAAGKVLAIASNGHNQVSVGGGTKLSRIANHNMAGVLTDGALRDFDELTASNATFYCSTETVRWGGDIILPYSANKPVALRGVTIYPGDYIYADLAGVVVIPESDIETILEEAVAIEAEDAAFIDKIKDENPDDVKASGSNEN